MSYPDYSVWIGFDPREAAGYAVTKWSIIRSAKWYIDVRPLILDELIKKGLYYRETTRKDNKLWDEISQAPMATEFAISRFLVPTLARRGLALFVDCDVLIRSNNIEELFQSVDLTKAVSCVKHNFTPSESIKMDGQTQTVYPRKNWSSVTVFNCDHPSNYKLTVDMVNSLPGRDLHRFCWLEDNEIGELGPEWNWLVRHSPDNIEPKIIHFTDGLPFMPGYEKDKYSDEWRSQLVEWANC